MARPIAMVVQRYGLDLVGGSETLAREYAERLTGRGFEVTVYTTTARDYLTWAPHYSAGSFEDDGVVVRRFHVDPPDPARSAISCSRCARWG